MEKIRATVVANDLSWEALSSAPAFALQARSSGVLDAAFASLAQFGIRAEDIRLEGTPQQPSSFVLVCNLPQWRAIVRVRVTGVEISTDDPRIAADVDAGLTLLNAVLGMFGVLGTPVRLASQTFSFAYHLNLEGADVPSWFSRYPAPPGMETAGVTLRMELARHGLLHLEFQPSYVHPGPNRIFTRVTCRFSQEHSPQELVREAVQGRDRAWDAAGLEVMWEAS